MSETLHLKPGDKAVLEEVGYIDECGGYNIWVARPPGVAPRWDGKNTPIMFWTQTEQEAAWLKKMLDRPDPTPIVEALYASVFSEYEGTAMANDTECEVGKLLKRARDWLEKE